MPDICRSGVRCLQGKRAVGSRPLARCGRTRNNLNIHRLVSPFPNILSRPKIGGRGLLTSRTGSNEPGFALPAANPGSARSGETVRPSSQDSGRAGRSRTGRRRAPPVHVMRPRSVPARFPEPLRSHETFARYRRRCGARRCRPRRETRTAACAAGSRLPAALAPRPPAIAGMRSRFSRPLFAGQPLLDFRVDRRGLRFIIGHRGLAIDAHGVDRLQRRPGGPQLHHFGFRHGVDFAGFHE